MATEINNQQINQPVVVADVMNGQTIAMLQAVYPLTEADFVRLQRNAPITATSSVMIFSGVVGYAIGLGPKLESIVMGGQPFMSNGELKTIVGWTAFSLIIYVVGYLFPSERKKVMKNLCDHFNATKSSTHIMGGGK